MYNVDDIHIEKLCQGAVSNNKLEMLLALHAIHDLSPYNVAPLLMDNYDGTIFQLALDKNMNINGRDGFLDTALILACLHSNMDAVRHVVAAGAKLNLQNAEGDTALITATREGHIGIVVYLVDWGAFTNVRNKDNHTALDLAKRNGHIALSNMLQNNRRVSWKHGLRNMMKFVINRGVLNNV